MYCHHLPLSRKYAPEVKKQPRDLSNAGQKSRELTTPPEQPNTLYDYHDNISAEGFLGRFFFVYSLYVPSRDFSCTFCLATVVSVTVCLVVLGAAFS